MIQLKNYKNSNWEIYRKLYEDNSPTTDDIYLGRLITFIKLLEKWRDKKVQENNQIKIYLESFLTNSEIESLFKDLSNSRLLTSDGYLNSVEISIKDHIGLLYYSSLVSHQKTEREKQYDTLKTSFSILLLDDEIIVLDLTKVSYEEFSNIYLELSLLGFNFILEKITVWKLNITLLILEDFKKDYYLQKIEKLSESEVRNIIKNKIKESFSSIDFSNIYSSLTKVESLDYYNNEVDVLVDKREKNIEQVYERVQFLDIKSIEVLIESGYNQFFYKQDLTSSNKKKTIIFSKSFSHEKVSNEILLLDKIKGILSVPKRYWYDSNLDTNSQTLLNDFSQITSFYNDIRNNFKVIIFDKVSDSFILWKELVEQYWLSLKKLQEERNGVFYEYNRIKLNDNIYIFTSLTESELFKIYSNKFVTGF